MGAPPSTAEDAPASDTAITGSVFTDLSLDACTIMRTDDFGTTWACAGYRGFPVMVAEADRRFALSYGLAPRQEKAARQTLPPFNTVGGRIEWRLGRQPGQPMPVATIVRYRLDQGGESAGREGDGGEVLVVTRLGEGQTCHVAYVDARANADADDLARTAADRAAAFDCATEPEIVGEFAAWAR